MPIARPARPPRSVAGLALVGLLAAMQPAPAQSRSAQAEFGIDPRAATALTTMSGITAEYCKRGSREACEFAERLQTATTRLVAAQEACARGMRQGCEAVAMGVAEISVAYERFGRGTSLSRTLPRPAAPERAPGQGPDIFGR